MNGFTDRIAAVAVATGVALACAVWAAASVGAAQISMLKKPEPDHVIGNFVLAKWGHVVGREWAVSPDRDEACARKLGRDCRMAGWRAFIDESRKLDPAAQVRAVHRFVNRVPYVEDSKLWGKTDYWAAPGEFFARGGDCEDYAIAKYLSLRLLGFAAEDLSIVVLQDTRIGMLHAVLLVRLGGELLMLDNNAQEVLTLEARPQYRPIYAFNDHEVRL